MSLADEGVYVNTYGKVAKNVVLQWGEMPSSVGKSFFVSTWSGMILTNTRIFNK